MDSHAVKLAICRHIKTNGHRCQSPAITGSVFCYFTATSAEARCRLHSQSRAPAPRNRAISAGERPESGPARHFPALNFPPLEDAESVQLAISRLFAAIAAGQIDPVQARSLLYALQIASCNVRALAPAPASAEDLATLAAESSAHATAKPSPRPAKETASPPRPTAQNPPGKNDRGVWPSIPLAPDPGNTAE